MSVPYMHPLLLRGYLPVLIEPLSIDNYESHMSYGGYE
jgi:hypothetical protein